MAQLKSILFCIVCLFVGITAKGQTTPFKLYTIHDGLPQSQILTLFQDSRGYIWAGTYNGLACFNGVSFHTLTPKDSLPYSLINCIQEDTKGNIWFTASRWLCKYDGQRITYDSFNIRTPRGNFLIDKFDNFWTISADSVPYISHDGKTWQPYSAFPPSVKNLKWTSLVYKNADSTLFMQSEKGHLLYLRNKTWHFVRGGERVNLNSTYGFGFHSFDNIFCNGNNLYVWEQDTLRFLQTLRHTPMTFPVYSTQKRHLLYRTDCDITN